MKRNLGFFCQIFLLFVGCCGPVWSAETEKLTLSQPVPLYGEANLNSVVLMQVNPGQSLVVLHRDENWLKVEIEGRIGYLTADSLGVQPPRSQPSKGVGQKKDRLFILGLGMLRFNWTRVQGDAIRFRYSDLGLPADFSTRERASFTLDGSLENGYTEFDGYLNYDPENRISEPPLDFLFNARRGALRLSVGDYRQGVMSDAVFSRYYHPFRGAILGLERPGLRLEILGGVARGEAAVDQLPADLGIGPYYLKEAPVLRGSETLYLVTRSGRDGQSELQRRPLQRGRDYHIDVDRGVIMLTFYLPPSDELGNLHYLEVAYQFESLAGRFTRALFGARGEWQPWRPLTLSLSYLADMDQSLPLERIFEDHKGILSFGLKLTSQAVDLQSELSLGLDPNDETRKAYFASGRIRPLKHVSLMVNSWDLDAAFPVFANRQLEYGYSLMQINPELNARAVFLSPFQFTRNLGSELYPFGLARLAVDERETHGMVEWESGANRISAGYGVAERMGGNWDQSQFYTSFLHLGESTVGWLKAGGIWEERPDSFGERNQYDLLGGFRQRLKRFSGGDLFLQFDAGADWQNEAGVDGQANGLVFSLAGEYLSGQNGLFAGVRRETIQRPGAAEDLSLWAMEFGVKHPLWVGFFVDSRYRHEETEEGERSRNMDFVSFGLGFEQAQFRALARYEVQANRVDEGRNRRQVWSLYLYGSPVQNMSLSLQYFHQSGRDDQPLVLTRRGEDQFNFRLVWRPWRTLNLYSQWRYDTQLELLPPLDEIQSHSLASVQGLKLSFGRRFEVLANYKLIKVWGPIENRKYSMATELGYLLFSPMRVAIGLERIDYRDRNALEADYQSTVGYLKLVVIF